MEILAILIALGGLQLWGSGGPVQRDGWFVFLRDLATGFNDGPIGRAVTILVPVFVVVSVERSLDKSGYGLFELLLMVVVLLYSLGRGDLTRAIAEYQSRWRRGDFEGAFQTLKREPVVEPDESMIHEPAQMHGWVRRRIYYRSFERLFAVLFWFTLAGAGGALLYRLSILDEREEFGSDSAVGEESEEETFPFVFWLEWIPARLLGLSFALTGHFDACMEAWKRGASESGVDSALLLEGCGNSALQIGGTLHTAENTEAMIRRGNDEIDAVEELQRRTLVVWVVVIAVIEMLI